VTIQRGWDRLHQAAGGLPLDLGLYLVGCLFAAITASGSTLAPHRAWGAVAAIAYGLAALTSVGQLLTRRRFPQLTDAKARSVVAALTAVGVTAIPLIGQAISRANGRTDRAQEEVIVVENAAQRLLDHGTPYLTQHDIAALPPTEWLLGYLPYQPGMAIFGLPRAALGPHWWTDARIWFAAATAAAIIAGLRLLARPDNHDTLIRAGQAIAVLPIAALTLATGGDDLPVLALCLLGLACTARGRAGAAGLAFGAAAALKLFAWPIVGVAAITIAVRHRRQLPRFAAGAIGLPLATLLPALIVDPRAFTDNVIGFPLGHGLVTSPAQSPLPGHLIAAHLPGGHAIAMTLLVSAGAYIAYRMWRQPPTTATAAAAISAWGMLAATLLLPATRFGYLLYPAALAIWAPALATADRR